MRRTYAPLVPLTLFLALSACKGGSGNAPPTGTSSNLSSVEMPKSWESNEAAVVMRLTNASTVDISVKNGLNQIFNDADDPIDGIDFLMRRPERDAAGNLVPIDTSKANEDLIAGSAIEQLAAYKKKLIDGDQVPYRPEDALDSCGNEMIASIVTPNVIQEVFSTDVSNLDLWPDSCPDGADCNTATQGLWDVGITPMRFDGMLDMVINVTPNLNVDPIGPGLWGHFGVFFLTSNNPGAPMLSLIANVRRVQVNLLSVWQLDRAYTDPFGTREVFKFPHRSRTFTSSDVFVYMEPYELTEEYWSAQPYGNQTLPYGDGEGYAWLIDQTSTAGDAVARASGTDLQILDTLTEVINYQVATALSCPTIEDPAYVRSGPVEIFVCPDTDIGTCIAREDMEEAACRFEFEPEFDIFNPTEPLVEFPRVLVTAPGVTVQMPEAQLPTYLSAPVDGISTMVEIVVTADSVLYMYDPEHITGVVNATNNLPVALPAPVADTHCPDAAVQRFDIGATWGPGTYRMTVDYSAGDGVVFDADALTPAYELWMHFTSIPTWTPPG